MPAKKKTDEVKEFLETVKPLVTEQGLKISGMGILAENTKKILEDVVRMQKNVYFMEQRQQRIEKLLEEKFGKLE